ncbi:agmatine deiminase family protein [Paludisphaera mucosa]|uniref:Agmatine deiminase family protein n=1 Tax=Paludisphaera mucosa TaxID=3030827 RepID=A0ABT6FF02_9BACT|nr:agmatine deiminase family protein [Paludisphaera mucosa]MDG3006107.1 agmatine deiminase family protein [Paludisphaera mucosa]
MTSPTPAQLGFRMPAEWEPHEATWIAWPYNHEDWPGKFAPTPWVYSEIVRVLSRHEKSVVVVVADGAMKRAAAKVLEKAGVNLERVRFFKAATDRVWLRDSGPTFVVRDGAPSGVEGEPAGPVAMVNWKFNAWAKYDNYHEDRRLGRRIAEETGLHRWAPRVEIDGAPRRVVLEGGSIDVNGRGTLLTTEECLLSDVQERNPGLDRAGYERVFAENLGVSNVVWLGRGVHGDDTHGHVDDIARFVDARTVVAVVEPNVDDPNHEPLQDNLRRLREARDQDGEPLRVVELPMPAPVTFEGDVLPASYANFYIADGVVIVPTFNDPNDRVALNTLAELFPGRSIVGIHCVDLVLGLGTLHCLSQQQPAEPTGG